MTRREFAEVIFKETGREETPLGSVPVVLLEWVGDTRLPIRVWGLQEEHLLKHAPWPLRLAERREWEGSAIYFRRDTNPIGAPLWNARHVLVRAWRRLALRLAWTAIIWGLAVPQTEARAYTSPIKRWKWQKENRK